ncbi:MAG: chlorite dismutase [Acidimicrobiia bacterium]|nr:chlorite dismutase [Acidimicrobiia bacterium]
MTGNSAVGPTVGLGALHLFGKVTGRAVERQPIVDAVEAVRKDGGIVVPVALLGHKGDLALMALHRDFLTLRRLQTAVVGAGVELVDSYLSLTEVSEYADGLPENMKQARLHPKKLPPGDKRAWCFYPMSKRRNVGANWFRLPFDERKALMAEHGQSGRAFAGRILQLITGSTGLDDFEWGVTLFADHPDDLKEVVYTLRYDEASALYGEFGTFYTGICGEVDEVLAELGA